MRVVPMGTREANDFVENFHRHRGRTGCDRAKFAIGASTGDELVGVALVGRPLARALDDSWTAEVLRVCAKPAAPKNVNSFLYSACWRIWRAMGGRKLITYTLVEESGSSLRGAGWRIVAEVRPHPGGWASSGREREWDPIYGQRKFRWETSIAANPR